MLRGSLLLFSDFVDDGEMWSGSGDRFVRRTVTFDEAFKQPPMVHVGIEMWDTDSSFNQRLDIRATDVTPEGFTIEFRTWDNSRIARLRAGWLAIGPVPHVDDWDSDD